MKALILALGLVLAGCGAFTKTGTIPVSPALSQAAQTAQSAIHEANVLLNSAAVVIGQNKVDGITPKEVAQAQLDQVRGYAKDLDRAQAMLDAGDVLGAKTKAELTARLITALHKHVAEKARTK